MVLRMSVACTARFSARVERTSSVTLPSTLRSSSGASALGVDVFENFVEGSQEVVRDLFDAMFAAVIRKKLLAWLERRKRRTIARCAPALVPELDVHGMRERVSNP